MGKSNYRLFKRVGYFRNDVFRCNECDVWIVKIIKEEIDWEEWVCG